MKYLGLILAVFFVVACTEAPETEKVRFVNVKTDKEFRSMIESVEWITLETDDIHLLGSSPELEIAPDGSFVLIDKRNSYIFRYASDGRFLNSIGRKGNGPGEYNGISGTHLLDTVLYVYASPDKTLIYDLDGIFMHVEKHEACAAQFYNFGEGVLTYYGFGMGKENRLSFTENGRIMKYLRDESLSNVIHYTPSGPEFSECDGIVYIVDSYKPDIYSFDSGGLKKVVSFDFGDYAIDETFFSFEEPYAAMDYLLGKKFAIINRFNVSPEYSVAEFYLQSADKLMFRYGIRPKDGAWKWFSLGEEGKDPFAGALRQIQNNAVYFLVDPDLAPKAGGPELPDNSNYLICKMTLNPL